MISDIKFVPAEIAEEIKGAAKIKDVVADYVDLKPSGSSFIGTCPSCGTPKKLNISPGKKKWKCFKCDIGGSDAISFLTKMQGKEYVEALVLLADRYNIIISEQKEKKKRASRKMKFRDKQLRDSGIPVGAQKYKIHENDKNNTVKTLDRYQPATIDKFWNVTPGDDMVIHYLDLEGKPLLYHNERKQKRPLLRVRWANPSLHKDKDGNPMRYKQPYQSGSHLWLPNPIIEAFSTAQIIETLYITEGEKKADKMCLHGLWTVGIMGINNFANGGEMPYQFEMLIKKCGVSKVVFLLDSDWQDISIKNPLKSVDQRPKTFYKAVAKFRDYFRAYYNEGIELDIFFGHGKDDALKGIDDLLVRGLKGKEVELLEDFKKAMLDRKGEGKYVNVYKITDISDYKLKEFWNLHSTPAFLNQHKEVLKPLREFKLELLKRKWNEETGTFELIEKILPHEQFWQKIYDGEDKNGKEKYKYAFDYVNILHFLKNRGYGLYEINEEKFRFVHLDGKVLKETNPHKIQNYVLDFARELQQKPVEAMLLRGGEQYLGAKKLSRMYYVKPEFNKSEKNCQFLYFKNCYWKITAEAIVQRPLADLPKHIWKDKIIDFEPTALKEPLMQIERIKDTWKTKTSKEVDASDIANFFFRSSNFHWKKEQRLHTDEDGQQFWIEKEQKESISDEDIKILKDNLVCKMLATGYVLHDYLDYANMKAIVGMDGIESEVGKSQGGTGKSVWGTMFQYLVPQIIIDGKKSRIEDDNHLYENVDERTQCIVFDDVRVNFNSEFLFSQITQGVTVNPKGEKRFKIKPPKFIILTNHALNGEGNSYERRQYTISFSDYYNKHRTIGDDFGHQLFHEWEAEQWNLFYNWMATCIQTYLKFGLKYTVPKANLYKRKLRQQIGENLLDWLSLMYDEKSGPFLNSKVEKVFMTSKYLEQYPTEKRWMNPKRLKEKLTKFTEYAGLDFNPTEEGDRIKSNGKEYFIIANKDFDARSYPTIRSEEDMKAQTLPY